METTEQTAETTPYDPTGEAAALERAAARVKELKRPDGMPDDPNGYWNAALDQAAKALDSDARKIKQGNGMYYRVLDGTGMPSDS